MLKHRKICILTLAIILNVFLLTSNPPLFSKLHSEQANTVEKEITNDIKEELASPEVISNNQDKIYDASNMRWCLREEIRLKKLSEEASNLNVDTYVLASVNKVFNRFHKECDLYKINTVSSTKLINEVYSRKPAIEKQAVQELNNLIKSIASRNADIIENDLIDVQEMLRRKGYIIDTKANTTELAIEAYQRDHQLVVDGEISELLLERLQIR